MPLSSQARSQLVQSIDAETSAPVKKILHKALELEGSMQWVPAGSTRGWKKTPSSSDNHKQVSMVCWLAPLYIAWQAGIANDKMLTKYQCCILGAPPGGVGEGYVSYAESSHMGAEAFYRADLSKAYPPANAGSVVLFYRSNYDHAVHYAMSMGGDMVASIWSQPNNCSNLQFCTVQSLCQVIDMNNPNTTSSVRSVSPPWLEF